MAGSGRVHDRAILDALDAASASEFKGTVWRMTRDDREPLRGSTASGRWSPGNSIDVLYTSLQKEGAQAEIGYRLSLEPVWPSRISHSIHQIELHAPKLMRFADLESLRLFQVDIGNFQSFDYSATQALAAAIHFLEFDGIVAPSARHDSLNLILFMDRDAANNLRVVSSEPVNWYEWRAKNRNT